MLLLFLACFDLLLVWFMIVVFGCCFGVGLLRLLFAVGVRCL